MREGTPQEPCSRLIGVTSHTTPLPCGGGVGGGATLSWAQNSAQKGSVRSVSSVRKRISSVKKRTPLRARKNSQRNRDVKK